MLMYQHRRDSARFDHITTEQRVLWRYYCFLRTEENKRIFEAAYKHGAMQAIKNRKDVLMVEAQDAPIERKREILDELTRLQTQMESYGRHSL